MTITKGIRSVTMKQMKSVTGEFVLLFHVYVLLQKMSIVAHFIHFEGHCKIPLIVSKTVTCSSDPREAICRLKKLEKYLCEQDWKKINCVRYGIFLTWTEMGFLILMNTL